MSLLQRLSSTPRLRVALLLAAVALLLAPSLGGTWIWDDVRLISESPTVQDVGSIPGFWFSNLQQGSGDEGTAAPGLDVYRPVYLTWFALLWAVAPGSPAAFHGGLLAWHLLVVWLVWRLARLLDERPGPAEAVALLVALHPVTSEAWGIIGSSGDPMSVALLLAACLLGTGAARGVGVALGVGALVTAAVFTKETALLALPALTWLGWRRGLRMELLPAWAGAGLYLVLRHVALGGLQATNAAEEHRLAALHHAPLLLVDGLRGVATMRPLGLRHLADEYGALGWGWSAGAAAVLLVLAGAAWALRKRWAGLGVALVLTVCMVGPVAQIIALPGWGGFGRYLYGPAAAFALAAVQGLRAFAVPRPVSLGAFAALLGLQLVALPTVLRDWSDPRSLAESGVRQAPEVGVHWSWLGELDAAEGRLDEAIERFERGVGSSPRYPAGWTLYLEALRQGGRCERVLDVAARKTAELGPGPKSELAAAWCLIQLGRHDAASDRLIAAIEAGGSQDLERLAVELVKVHPGRWDYRDGLQRRLEQGDEPRAAALLLPVLAQGRVVDPRPAPGGVAPTDSNSPSPAPGSPPPTSEPSPPASGREPARR